MGRKVTPEDAQGAGVGFSDELCEPGNGAHVARLTVRGMESSVMFEALFQGKDANGVTWQMPASLSIVKDDCVLPCPGDVDGDSMVDVTDLLAVISAWGPCVVDADVDGSRPSMRPIVHVSAWGSYDSERPAVDRCWRPRRSDHTRRRRLGVTAFLAFVSNVSRPAGSVRVAPCRSVSLSSFCATESTWA